MSDWREHLKADPLPYLLSTTEPAVVWWALRDLLDRSAGDPTVVSARLASRDSAPARTILAAQRRDGSWVKRQHLYSPKHLATTWQLDILADLGFSGDDEPVRRACQLFFAFQSPDGAFNISRDDRAGYPCITGRTLAQLHRLGLGAYPAADKAWSWLIATQRPDGGWHCRDAAARKVPHSCLIGSVKTMEAAAAARAERTSGGFQPPDDLVRRGAAFLHATLLAPRAERFTSPALWDRLVYPNHWYDAAGLVDLLAGFGYGAADPKIAAALLRLAALQNPDGSWNHAGQLGFHGATQYDFGQPGKPSPWVTLRAARAIKRAHGAAPAAAATI